MSIVQRVLLSHLSLLYSCLNPGNPPEVIKSALKLLTAMVTQGPSAAREIQRSFDFTLKSLSSLPNKRDSKVYTLKSFFICTSRFNTTDICRDYTVGKERPIARVFYYRYLYFLQQNHTNIHEWISNNNDDEDDNDGYNHKLFRQK